MASLLLAIIYLAFISLGLPDSLLGSAWPVLYRDLDVPISFAGIITFIISCGTVISSLLSDCTTRRFGAGKVTAFSVLMTAVALFGFAVSGKFWMLCLWAVPYGLGAGGVDAALNNYVALHYASRHMNWLHCFWGVGVTLSPFIMSSCLLSGAGWQAGYRWVSIIQIVLTAFLFLSLPLWARQKKLVQEKRDAAVPVGLRGAFRIPGVREILIGFFCYCALEQSAGLWASTYLVLNRGVAEEIAARWAAFYYLGITVGRFLSGFVSDRVGDRNMIRAGLSLILLGVLAILLPVPAPAIALAGLLLVGLGCAPVYPAIIHETPANFGARNSQAIIGIQMASAYVGTTVVPPVFGIIAQYAGIVWYPCYLLIILALMAVMLERMNRIVDRHGRVITSA